LGVIPQQYFPILHILFYYTEMHNSYMFNIVTVSVTLLDIIKYSHTGTGYLSISVENI